MTFTSQVLKVFSIGALNRNTVGLAGSPEQESEVRVEPESWSAAEGAIPQNSSNTRDQKVRSGSRGVHLQNGEQKLSPDPLLRHVLAFETDAELNKVLFLT